MDKINEIQAKILCSLLFNPKARFKDLNIDQLTTDNFSYHIKSLLNLELIKKENMPTIQRRKIIKLLEG